MKAVFKDSGLDIPELDKRFDRLEKKIDDNSIHPENYSLIQACARKGAVKYGTVKGDPMQQPWIGWSNQHNGRSKTWPDYAITEWCKVWDENRVSYIRSLLSSSNEDLVIGIKAVLHELKNAGRLPSYIWKGVRDLMEFESVA